MAKILRSNIPYRNPKTENLIEFIRDGLRNNSQDKLIVDSQSGRSWTGAELESTVARLAKYLIEECKLNKGDVCNLYCEENDKISICILAVIAAGGVCLFLSDKNSGREVHDTANAVGSKLLISHNALLKRIQPDLADIDDRFQVVSLDEPRDGFKNGCRSIKCLFDKETARVDATMDDLVNSISINVSQDYAVIQFSSGTTGKPKPIPRTHSNLCHLVASVDHKELMDLRPGVVIAGSLPITHRPGLWALLASVNCGSTFVIWSNTSDVHDTLGMIEKYKVTIFSSSLPLLSALGNIGLSNKDKYDTSSLQHIITSGAKIVNADLPAALVSGFNLKSLRQCFGMTESGWVFLVEQSHAKDNYLTVGHVVPGMEAVILKRDSDEPVETEVRGEVALRGPQIFPGYLTDKVGVLNRSDFTADGWFRIGDQGYYDKDEMIFIEGRYKEVMMFENNALFFPTEIEAIVSEHPSVEGSCVVKVAEVRQDYPYDIARAYVTLKQDSKLSPQEMVEFVRARAPGVILGGGVVVLDKFPRLQNGKVDKQSLARS